MRKRNVTAKFTMVKASTSFGGASWYYKIHPTHKRNTSLDSVSLPVFFFFISPLRFFSMSRVSRSLNSISRNLSSTFQTGYTQSRCVYQQFAYIFYSYRSIFLTLFVYLVSNPQPFYSSVFLRRSTARANSLSSREMLPIRFSLVSSRTKRKRKKERE